MSSALSCSLARGAALKLSTGGQGCFAWGKCCQSGHFAKMNFQPPVAFFVRLLQAAALERQAQAAAAAESAAEPPLAGANLSHLGAFGLFRCLLMSLGQIMLLAKVLRPNSDFHMRSLKILTFRGVFKQFTTMPTRFADVQTNETMQI